MTNELKPKKITHKKGYVYETEEENGFESGFNEACDQWEAYIKTPEFLQSLIDEGRFEVSEDLAKAIFNDDEGEYCLLDIMDPDIVYGENVLINYGMLIDILAKAISQNASKIIRTKEAKS